jgi:hypothetical protein
MPTPLGAVAAMNGSAVSTKAAWFAWPPDQLTRHELARAAVLLLVILSASSRAVTNICRSPPRASDPRDRAARLQGRRLEAFNVAIPAGAILPSSSPLLAHLWDRARGHVSQTRRLAVRAQLSSCQPSRHPFSRCCFADCDRRNAWQALPSSPGPLIIGGHRNPCA